MWARLLSNVCLSKWSLNVWWNGSNDSNVALLCNNAHILPKKHSGTRAIFNFFRAIDNSNFYWKILSLGHFFQVVQMLFSFVFFNTLQHLVAGMIPWMVLQRNQDIWKGVYFRISEIFRGRWFSFTSITICKQTAEVHSQTWDNFW